MGVHHFAFLLFLFYNLLIVLCMLACDSVIPLIRNNSKRFQKKSKKKKRGNGQKGGWDFPR